MRQTTLLAPPRAEDSTAEDRAGCAPGDAASLTVTDVARRAATNPQQVERLCSALGIRVPQGDDRAFSSQDADVLRWIRRIVDLGLLNEDTEFALLRAISTTAERLALWQFETLVDDAARELDVDDASATMVVLDRIEGLADILQEQMVYAWRRHLEHTIRTVGRTVTASADGEKPASSSLPLPRAVGFADLVGYTALSQNLSAADLATLVRDFAAMTGQIVVAGGGRVVKSLGDGVMFSAETPGSGAAIAWDLAQTLGSDGVTPPARVAMVWGRVLARMGDLFGPPVNLAARLAASAEPGEVVVDEAAARILQDDDGMETEPMPARHAAGIGEVFPYRLIRRSGHMRGALP